MSTDQNVALSIRNVSKAYGDLKVLKNVNLDVAGKELLVLLGPSGCGKTTLLKIIAGLLPSDAGTILLNGKDISNTAAYHRDIGMVFQNYALFPHRTVFQNIAFGLRMRGIDKKDIRRRVASGLELMRLVGMENRSIKQLSGGQQQRVALARALVLNPSLLLMDEPLSNLDAKLRAAVRVEIAQIQRKLGLTAVLVTHDQTEAMTMGDRIILMKDGVIQQSATPTYIYEQPNTVFVASFIGSPQINLFDIVVRDRCVEFEEFSHSCPDEQLSGLLAGDIGSGSIPAGRYIVGVRPEDFIHNSEASSSFFDGEVTFVEYLGADNFIHVKVNGKQIVVRNPQDNNFSYSIGSKVRLGFRPGKVHLFEADSQKRVCLS